jgi:hypothetical protein
VKVASRKKFRLLAYKFFNIPCYSYLLPSHSLTKQMNKMDSPTHPKAVADMTEQELRDAIIQMEATIAELDKADTKKTQDIHNLRDRHSPETTNKIESPTFPEPAAGMTEQEARDAIIQMKAVMAEQDKIIAEKIQRMREFHDEHKSRKSALAEMEAVAAADPEKLAKIVVSLTRPHRRLLSLTRLTMPDNDRDHARSEVGRDHPSLRSC